MRSSPQQMEATYFGDARQNSDWWLTGAKTMTHSYDLDGVRAFAISAHGAQKYGDHPYSFHLDAVAQLLSNFGKELEACGYLHDVLEDTRVTEDDLRDRFGDRVARIVALVTDETGESRRIRKAKTNAKLAKLLPKDYDALIVKAADRLANIAESAIDQNISKLGMYRHEHLEFQNAVYRPGICDEFWNQMSEYLLCKES